MITQRILIIDDEELNLKIVNRDVTAAGYETVLASSGEKALNILKNDNNFDLILLDRMMPDIDGMQLLRTIKTNADLKNIPVIMQTAAASNKEMQEGIDAGVFYYLTKPFEEDILLAIINQAILDSNNKKNLLNALGQNRQAMSLMQCGSFYFQNMDEIRNLSFLLASSFPEPERVITGLNELMVNAMEHGNLGITYQEKKELLKLGTWSEEIEERLKRKEFSSKKSLARLDRFKDKITVSIKDEGKGFNSEEFMDFSAERATDPNGRGIATAKANCFDEIKYIGCGNEVVCTVFLKNGGTK